MILKDWVKYVLITWCCLDFMLVTLVLYMLRIIEIGG